MTQAKLARANTDAAVSATQLGKVNAFWQHWCGKRRGCADLPRPHTRGWHSWLQGWLHTARR
jgi:hypothetical protein